jgi:very-short-patch-repair endonuclease
MNQRKTGSGVISLQYVKKGKKRQARMLRAHATPAEKILWELLRNRKVAGLKFRRQQIIDGFIADFFCEEARLVIELDGGIHDDPEQKKIDLHRENVFKMRGLSTLRIRNEMVYKENTVTELIGVEVERRLKDNKSLPYPVRFAE